MKSKLNRPIPEEVIESRNHPVIKRFRSLHQRAERDRTGLFVIEGVRFVARAVEHGAPIESLIWAPAMVNNPFALRLVERQRRRGTKCWPVAPDVLHSVALNDDPQGIVAVVRQRWEPLGQVDPTRGLCWLAFDMVQSPGNLGTIIRTCEAVGAAGIILIGDTVDAYAPAAVRASMGALWSLRYTRATMPEFLAWKQQHNCLLVGTSPAAPTAYDAIAYRHPLVLFMGWERKGLSPEQQLACDVMVRIPMVGQCDSLNLAVATGVMLYEVLRQCPVTTPPRVMIEDTSSGGL